jgi:Family of unknown function (DUF5985)
VQVGCQPDHPAYTLAARRSECSGLLLSSLMGFTALALNNCLLAVDLALFPTTNLVLLRNGTALVGVAVLLGGLIWETT